MLTGAPSFILFFGVRTLRSLGLGASPPVLRWAAPASGAEATNAASNQEMHFMGFSFVVQRHCDKRVTGAVTFITGRGSSTSPILARSTWYLWQPCGGLRCANPAVPGAPRTIPQVVELIAIASLDRRPCPPGRAAHGGQRLPPLAPYAQKPAEPVPGLDA